MHPRTCGSRAAWRDAATRTIGDMRLYSREELERIKRINADGDEAVINLAGVSGCCRSPRFAQRPAARAQRRAPTGLDECARSVSI